MVTVDRLRMLVILPLLAIIGSCSSAETTLKYSGKTMGTTYNVIAVAPSGTDRENLGHEIKATLARVNKHLSNWDPKSEISKFNTSPKTTPVAISDMMVNVISAANLVHSKSNGYFDITLAPAIELWGFGTRKPSDPIPSDAEIGQALALVGQRAKLRLDAKAKTLAKKDQRITVNVSAIAKGFGVDQVAATLRRFGVNNYMVEIGGDLVTSGTNAAGQKWRIGIEKPDTATRSIQLAISVSNLGMATSGDYRNYKEHAGKRYSHIIAPETGRPVTHSTASVTVVSGSAMMADAWATALLALGAEKGMPIAKQHGIAALFVKKAGNGHATPGKSAFVTLMSPRFADIQAGN